MRLSLFFVILIIIWLAALLPTIYFEVVSLQVTHSYVLPSANCIGRLTSERWGFSTVREGLLMCCYLMAPWTIALMLWSKERIGWTIHILFGFVFAIWFLVNFFLDITDMAVANDPPNSNTFKFVNYARDTRWCTLYGGQPGTDLLCTNTAPCSGGGILIEDLRISNPFLFRFSINIFFFLFICMDIFYSFRWEYGIPSSLKKQLVATKKAND